MHATLCTECAKSCLPAPTEANLVSARDHAAATGASVAETAAPSRVIGVTASIRWPEVRLFSPARAYWTIYALRVPDEVFAPLLCAVSDQNTAIEPAPTGTRMPWSGS